MKGLFVPLISICTAVLFTSCASRNSAQATIPPDDSYTAATVSDEIVPGNPAITADWPITFSRGGITYSIFAPQCDSWNGHYLIGRSAVAVQVLGQSQPVYGTIRLNAITLVDKNTRTLKLADMKVSNASFPTASSQTQNYLAALRGLPQREPSLSLDRVQGSLTLAPVTQTQRLNNTPPAVIADTRPAVLVSIDGPPVWKPVPGTTLERAINTRVLLFRDASGPIYLHLFDGYLQANSLETRNWTVTTQIPAGAALAQQQALVAGNADLMRGNPATMTGREPSLTSSAIPDVFVATTPAELITFSGAPEYVPISGTDLLYADNTSGNVFKLLTDQQNYVLLAGRWYRAPSLNGPWQFVPGNELPRDFANIPDTSPKENVKASVPGTPQAQEALIANSIPQSAAVPVKQPMENPQLDGAPQLAPIEDTPLHYVVNSETPIIEVGPQSWYACQDGVWYFSTSVNGPWSVATLIPPVIYTIPTSSPLHYLTYVQVYGSAPDDVYEGYTPGYLGTEVAPDDTVVYGTGYDYEPWIGSDWYCPPLTWGYGFAPCWTPWCGWGFNCGFGWGCGYPGFGWWNCSPPFPFWGGYHGFHHFGFGHHGWGRGDREGWAHTGVNFYHHGQFGGNGFRNQFAESPIGAAGARGGFGRSYNSRTGQLGSGQWAGVRNVYGSAWNPSYRSGGFAGRPAYQGVARPMTSAPNVTWSRSVWNNGNHAYYGHYYNSPESWSHYEYRNYYHYYPGASFGWRGGNTRSGGWFRGGGGGNWFHGGGGFRGGSSGFHSGGGGGFHGGGGGGFHGGGGHGAGGGGHGR